MDLLNMLMLQLLQDVFYARTDLPLIMETLMLLRLLNKMVSVLQLIKVVNTAVLIRTLGIHYQILQENVLLKLLVLVKQDSHQMVT